MTLEDLIETVSETLISKEMMLVTAESCTGGLIAKLITDRPGSSSVLERGFVTYSNEAKIELLGVSPETISTYGAVSNQTALEMAQGALKKSRADISISVTGIAGPGGGTDDKPVGLVFIGIADKDHSGSFEGCFDGSREDIREQTAIEALSIILNHITR